MTGPLRFGFLGPSATFTEAALLRLMRERGFSDAERIPARSVDEALAAVASGELSGAVVPMENSLEGGVPATLDALTHHGDLQIAAETLIDVRFVLAVRPGTALEDVEAYGTHPHAEAQTRGWAAEHLSGARYVPAASTASAAEELSAGTADYQAAVCPALAAERYGLEVLAEDIGDRRDTVTRFVMVRKPSSMPPATGADKTTIVAALASDRAGSLLELLEQFSTRGVNLARIESRPTGDGLGLYQFSLDLVGHVSEPRISEALAGVHRLARFVQFLGSYPAAEAAVEPVDPRMTSDRFDAAEAWVDDIRSYLS